MKLISISFKNKSKKQINQTMESQFTPKKNWLHLNIDDSSEDEQSPQNQELKYQKIYDLPIDDQSYIGRRDAFSATKVSKGFFVNENVDQQFDNYEVKQKISSLTITQNKSIQLTIKIIESIIDDKKGESIKQNSLSQTPTKSQSQKEENQQSNDKSNQKIEGILQPQQQKEGHRKSKMFHLNLSDSSQDDLSHSQGQNESEQSHQQNQNKDQEILNDEKEINIQQKNKENHTKQQQIVSQFIKLNDFRFDKQPQYQVLDQIPKDKRLRAYISRSNSGLNMLWPEYEAKLQSNGLSLLLIKKQPFALSSRYNIYTKLISDKMRYFGKIQSNMARDFYQIYTCENNSFDTLRAQIDFQTFSKQNNQPRYFTVYLLKNEANASHLVGFQTFNKKSLKKCFQSHQNRDKILKLQTRKPVYSHQLKGFVLNFNGRINQASIKNFILEDTQTHEEIIMFGRLDKDHFKLQISNPLNCVIGTAIAMVQFESRLIE